MKGVVVILLKNKTRRTISSALVSLFIASSAIKVNAQDAEIRHSLIATELAQQFRSPPDSARPYTWWHWMDRNISKEGITADLEAMKEVGIGGATMFNVSYFIPTGPVAFMSDNWRALFKHAVQEADRMGLELGFHNCEGWSASGGPWISPGQSMQKLCAEQIRVSGPGRQTLELPQPEITRQTSGWGTSFPIEAFYRDIAIYAIRTPAQQMPIDHSLAEITCSLEGQEGGKLVDGDRQSWINLPQATPEAPQFITLEFPEPVTARSLEMHAYSRPGQNRYHAYGGEIQVSDNKVDFSRHASFQMVEDAVALSFPEASSRYWRIYFTQGHRGGNGLAIAEIELSPQARINNWLEKAGSVPNLHRNGPFGNSPALMLGDPDAEDGSVSLGNVKNLTDRISPDGTLLWDVPPGDWTILRLGHTSTGKDIHFATERKPNLECDKLNQEAIATHYNAFAGTLAKDAGHLAGHSLTHVLMDSWEAGIQNWGSGMIEAFKERHGYDPLPYLPATQGYIVESVEVSERFLWDFRRTLADLYADVYIKTMKSLANEDGLSLMVEGYGNGNFDNYQCMSRGDIPMTEFWFGKIHPPGRRKSVSSITHTKGGHITAAESFTAHYRNSGWQAYPFALKNAGDIMFADGINQMFIHTWVHQPWPELSPGVTFGPWGINFGSQLTWFKQARAWTDYLTRCQFLLQQGSFLADVAIFTGEHAPNNSGGSMNAQKEGMPDGFDYDYVNDEVLEGATVKDGRITLSSGMSYRLLVLRETTMTPQLARKIRELVGAGAMVLGPKPERSPSLEGYPACDEEIRKIATEVWGNVEGKTLKSHSFGKGRVYNGISIANVLEADGLQPDMQWSKGELLWQHRRIEDTDIYFVANNEKKAVSTEISVLMEGKVPELWFPDNGDIKTCGVWRVEKGRTIVPLQLDPYGSTFLVLRKTGTPGITALSGDNGSIRITDGKAELIAHKNGDYKVSTLDGTQSISVSSIPEAVEVSGKWNLTFPPNLGAPGSAVFNKLISWTDHSDEGIKYFSGTATYTRDVQIPTAMIGKDKMVSIDLGRVEVIAELFVNEKPAGTLWKPPFKADISTLINAGKNRIEVRVTNLWRNRLIGDEQKPQQMSWQKQGAVGSLLEEWPEWLIKGKPRPETERVAFSTWRHYTKESELFPSGLLGPVSIQCAKVVKIR